MKNAITISADVINSVIKPMSFLLCDTKVGTKFTHVLLQTDEVYDINEKKSPVFTFASDAGGIWKFTMYDLKRFLFDGKPFLDTLLPVYGQNAYLTLEFTVVKCEPKYLKGKGLELENEDDRVYEYPAFCFEYFEEFLKVVEKNREENDANGTNHRVPQAEYTTLYESPIKDIHKDKFYRTLTLDKPLFYYEKPEEAKK